MERPLSVLLVTPETGLLRLATWTFHSAGRIVFGVDAIASLGDHLRELGAETDRVLVVTDEMLVEAGVCDQVTGVLDAAGIESEVFSQGCPEPPLASGQGGEPDRVRAAAHGVLPCSHGG